MCEEKYWNKSLQQTKFSIDKGCLKPLRTKEITRQIYDCDDFIIRKLDTRKFKQNKIIGPKLNPFQPWEKSLEIERIGDKHQLILNKYPVQLGHILLITRDWKPQNGWLDKKDWAAIKQVNKDTTGLWFFNSGSVAGASQPHRHIQLLRRNNKEKSCPREDWFMKLKDSYGISNKLKENISVKDFNFDDNTDNLYLKYLQIAEDLGLGHPKFNQKPLKPYNLLITNKWIAGIKRSKDQIYGYSINGLGFAGYILVTEISNVSYLKENGPEKLLENFV